MFNKYKKKNSSSFKAKIISKQYFKNTLYKYLKKKKPLLFLSRDYSEILQFNNKCIKKYLKSDIEKSNPRIKFFPAPNKNNLVIECKNK